MADLVITKANVIAGANPNIRRGTAGATVTAGQSVYEDATDSNSWKLADNDDTAAKAAAIGIAMNDALDGQPLQIITGGTLGLGAILTTGTVYVVSSTPGGIAPWADLTSGEYITVLGVATSTSNLRMLLLATGSTIA